MYKKVIAKIGKSFGIFVRRLAENPLPAIALLFSVVSALGALMFYRYDVLVELSEPKPAGEVSTFRRETYQQILKEWQARDERFETASSKNYINPFVLGDRIKTDSGAKKLSEQRTQELLSNPQIQELLKTTNLYQFYTTKGKTFLTVDERAKIWQELGLGQQGEYLGTYNQNITLLSDLKKELTK